MTMENQEAVPTLPNEGEVEEQEEITPEMIAQRQTAMKRLFWVLIVFSLIVIAFIIWELVDLGAK